MTDEAKETCPGCGQDELAISFRDGVCWYCSRLNQELLDEHNIAYDEWSKLTDAQRTERIR